MGNEQSKVTFPADFTRYFGQHLAAQVESNIRLRLKPKPRWLPAFVWEWMIRLVLRIEYRSPLGLTWSMEFPQPQPTKAGE